MNKRANKDHTSQPKPRRQREDGCIYQRPDGRYQGFISLGGGKRKYTAPADTEREVQVEIRKLQDLRGMGIRITSDRFTLGVYLTRWLRDTVLPRGKPNTYAFYESICRVHLIPELGSRPLGKLGPSEVKVFLNTRRAMGLSSATVLAIHATLKAALSEAMRDELLKRNVAMLVRTNDFTNKEIEQQEKFSVLTPQQAVRFLDALEGHPWSGFFVVSLLTGIRRAEVCGLRWRDIDFEYSQIRVHHSIVNRGRGQGTMLATLKGGSKSRRKLAMTPDVRDALIRQLEQQRQQSLVAGDLWREQDFVFTSAYGDHWHPDTASSTFQELIKLAGIPRVRLHDLRHTCATLLLTKGVHPKLVQEQLGHSRFATTMDRYSHVMPSGRTEVANAITEVMDEARKLADDRRSVDDLLMVQRQQMIQ